MGSVGCGVDSVLVKGDAQILKGIKGNHLVLYCLPCNSKAIFTLGSNMYLITSEQQAKYRCKWGFKHYECDHFQHYGTCC